MKLNYKFLSHLTLFTSIVATISFMFIENSRLETLSILLLIFSIYFECGIE